MSPEHEKRYCKSELFNILSWGGGKRYYREEELHSNVLAWLFYPKGSHGLGAKFAHDFLKKIHADVALGEDYSVKRESSRTKDARYRKADIKIESTSVCVVIENKWNARMGRKQMSATYDNFSEASEKKGEHFTYVVLSKNQDIKVDDKTPHILASYSDVCDIIRELLPLKTEPAATLLKEYFILLDEKASKWSSSKNLPNAKKS